MGKWTTGFPLSRIKRALSPLLKGLTKGQPLTSLKTIFSLFKIHTIQFLKALESHQKHLSQIGEKELEKLYHVTKGLHSLLPQKSLFTYSILISVHPSTDAVYLKKTLMACLKQTAPTFEILLGYKEGCPPPLFAEDEASYPETVKSFSCPSEKEIFNHLAQHAKGNFLLLMEAGNWIRPDLLFRFEQTLRLFLDPEKSVLTSHEFKIDHRDRYIPGSEWCKPEKLLFPYVFEDRISSNLLIPTTLWHACQGIRKESKSKKYYDLLLRLDLYGAEVHNVPFYLFANRQLSPTTLSASVEEDIGIRVLEEYAKRKQLNWSIQKGLLPSSYRAVPELGSKPLIQVIIPFKDQKELTLKTAHAILKQKGVQLFITAVDNNSCDPSVADELRQLGIEVLEISEPFNFSRLNNLAVKNSKTAQHCEYLLFLNNDVELEPDALIEMSRWINQPGIGLVGCRLHYPNGLVQHGGIELNALLPDQAMRWENTGTAKPLESSVAAQLLHIADAVTAACALIKRETFSNVNGFDEIWYPITYSDTHLAVKVKAKGLHSFYTPYAVGTHFESQTRSTHHIEDYECSLWLHKKHHEKLFRMSPQ